MLAGSAFLLGAPELPADSDEPGSALIDGKRLMREGVTRSDTARFLEARSLFEHLAAETPDRELGSLALYYAAYANYRLGPQSVGKKSEIVGYLDRAVDQLKQVIEEDEDFAEAYALLSSCYGSKIPLKPFAAMVLGPRSGRFMSVAKELAPDNPRVFLLDGVGRYHTPGTFGGGKEAALESLEESARLFDGWTNESPLEPDWGAEEVFAWIGVVQRDLEQPDLAKASFAEALRINPDYRWVQKVLQPSLDTGATSE